MRLVSGAASGGVVSDSDLALRGEPTSLIANHPALASEIAYTMGIHAAAYAIKLFWGFAELILAAADTVRVAIPANAAFVSDRNSQAVLRLIAPKQRGTCRQGDSSNGQSNGQKLLHGWREYQPRHRQERFKITANNNKNSAEYGI
jgi:hypothetical protein